jgi:vancomycin permeability regulator SanA
LLKDEKRDIIIFQKLFVEVKITKLVKKLMKIAATVIVFAVIAVLVLNGIVRHSAMPYIIKAENVEKDYDCILVLGCGVVGETPSPMLEDRLLTGVSLYEKGASSRLLMSGDNSRTDYDEVNVMKNFAKDAGIPSENIFMDHAGLSTYESMYRAKEIFGAKKVLIVTQNYHLYRAVYDARRLGINAYGVPADLRPYRGQLFRDVREIFARVKDVAYCIIKPEPTFLGEVIPISGNGDITND